MTTTVEQSPMQCLGRAMDALRRIGIVPARTDFAPINSLLEKISDLDADRIAVIARTLEQTSIFNEMVRQQTQEMDIGQKYEKIARAFDTIREDAKTMVDQLDDDKVDLFERGTNIWMKLTRGDIADRFEEIRVIYLEATHAMQDQVEREENVLEAYQDFRGALKQSEVLALEVLKKAETALGNAKEDLRKASEELAGYAGDDLAERARLEFARDERLHELQEQDKRYQISKDLANNLTVSYNTSDVIMARLNQTTSAKERVYAQAISFFSTNDAVLAALRASLTGLTGLHEATQSLEAMKDGVSRSIEVLSELGDKVQEAALRAGYGPTLRSDAVLKLVESITNFQQRTFEIVDEMRQLSTQNAEDIRLAVEAGRQRMETLLLGGADLTPSR